MTQYQPAIQVEPCYLEFARHYVATMLFGLIGAGLYRCIMGSRNFDFIAILRSLHKLFCLVCLPLSRSLLLHTVPPLCLLLISTKASSALLSLYLYSVLLWLFQRAMYVILELLFLLLQLGQITFCGNFLPSCPFFLKYIVFPAF